MPPDAANLADWSAYARSWLAERWGDHAPTELARGAVFQNSPLEGEGAVAVLPFRARRGTATEQDYFVVVGRTEPNYYPAFGLSVEEAYCLHLGTRFMLVLGVAQQSAVQTGEFDAAAEARMIVDRVQPGAAIDELTVAAAFDVEGQRHVVLRCRVAGKPVYILAGDAPMGFSTRVDLPPQVVYRVHLGHALRLEASPTEG